MFPDGTVLLAHSRRSEFHMLRGAFFIEINISIFKSREFYAHAQNVKKNKKLSPTGSNVQPPSGEKIFGRMDVSPDTFNKDPMCTLAFAEVTLLKR